MKQMCEKESCDEKSKTEKDERRWLFRKKRTGLDKGVEPPFCAIRRPSCRPPFRVDKSAWMCRWGWWLAAVLLTSGWVGASEFPERECCDPVYPPSTQTTAAPVTPPVQTSVKLIGEFSFLVTF